MVLLKSFFKLIMKNSHTFLARYFPIFSDGPGGASAPPGPPPLLPPSAIRTANFSAEIFVDRKIRQKVKMPRLQPEPPARRPWMGLMTVCTATGTPVFVRGEGFEAKAPKPKLSEMAKQLPAQQSYNLAREACLGHDSPVPLKRLSSQFPINK